MCIKKKEKPHRDAYNLTRLIKMHISPCDTHILASPFPVYVIQKLQEIQVSDAYMEIWHVEFMCSFRTTRWTLVFCANITQFQTVYQLTKFNLAMEFQARLKFQTIVSLQYGKYAVSLSFSPCSWVILNSCGLNYLPLYLPEQHPDMLV